MRKSDSTVVPLKGLVAGWLAVQSLCASASPEDTRYVVRHDPDEQRLYVRACFPAGRALSLRADSSRATDFLVFARGIDDERLPVRHDRITVAASDRPRCVRYGVDLEAIAAQRGMRLGYRIGDSVITWSGTWLWRPRQSLSGAPLTVQHPVDHAVSAPWPLVSRQSGRTVYRLDGSPSDWSNLIAFGPFTSTTLATPDGELRVALLDLPKREAQSKILAWLEATVDAVSHIHGRIPLPSPQVLVAPIDRGGGPVPWAQVQRGGGAAVHLFIRPEHDLDTFIADWTASHEFSHLFHPYLGGGGRWLAEGLASYYQNLSRARAGQLSELEAWQKLNAGFGRGRRDTEAGMTLRQANRRIREGRYMRVYWSGAAIALLADVELRRRSAGEVSLDTVLDRFADCHLPAERRWSPRELLGEFDRLAGHEVFMPLHRRYFDSDRFPDLGAAYQPLGLRLDRGRVRLDGSDATAVALRQSIMRESASSPERVAHCPPPGEPLS